MDLLLANGADINARNDEGITLLHIITDPDAIALLVGKGADLEGRDKRGWTPLIMQATNQQNGSDVVAALLANGANPNAKGNNGESALSFARKRGDAELMEILTKAGAKDWLSPSYRPRPLGSRDFLASLASGSESVATRSRRG